MPRHNKELVELIDMMSEDIVQPFDCQIERHVCAEAQVDHAHVRASFPDDEITEVTIVGDQDAILGICDPQDFDIGQPRWMLTSDSNRIVAETLKMWDQASVAALIEQKSHAPNDDPLVANCRSGRRPVSLACANESAAWTSSRESSG